MQESVGEMGARAAAQKATVDFVIVAARAANLSAELAETADVASIPKMLQGLVEAGDLRVSTIPMLFPSVLRLELAELHAGGILYEAGFTRLETLSMLVEAGSGSIMGMWVPQAVAEFAPHLFQQTGQ